MYMLTNIADLLDAKKKEAFKAQIEKYKKSSAFLPLVSKLKYLLPQLVGMNEKTYQHLDFQNRVGLEEHDYASIEIPGFTPVLQAESSKDEHAIVTLTKDEQRAAYAEASYIVIDLLRFLKQKERLNLLEPKDRFHAGLFLHSYVKIWQNSTKETRYEKAFLDNAIPLLNTAIGHLDIVDAKSLDPLQEKYSTQARLDILFNLARLYYFNYVAFGLDSKRSALEPSKNTCNIAVAIFTCNKDKLAKDFTVKYQSQLDVLNEYLYPAESPTRRRSSRGSVSLPNSPIKRKEEDLGAVSESAEEQGPPTKRKRGDLSAALDVYENATEENTDTYQQVCSAAITALYNALSTNRTAAADIRLVSKYLEIWHKGSSVFTEGFEVDGSSLEDALQFSAHQLAENLENRSKIKKEDIKLYLDTWEEYHKITQGGCMRDGEAHVPYAYAVKLAGDSYFDLKEFSNALSCYDTAFKQVEKMTEDNIQATCLLQAHLSDDIERAKKEPAKAYVLRALEKEKKDTESEMKASTAVVNSDAMAMEAEEGAVYIY